jgi:hypothetical protein
MSELDKTHTPLPPCPPEWEGLRAYVWANAMSVFMLLGADSLDAASFGIPCPSPDHAIYLALRWNSHEALTAENVSLTALLLEAQWSGATYSARGNSYCVFCNELPHRGHASDCKLAAALNGTPQPSEREQQLEDALRELFEGASITHSPFCPCLSTDSDKTCNCGIAKARALLKTEAQTQEEG